jgi:hypothetical protein
MAKLPDGPQQEDAPLARPIVRMRDEAGTAAPPRPPRRERTRAGTGTPPLVSAGQMLRAALLILVALICIDRPKILTNSLKLAAPARSFARSQIDRIATASIGWPEKSAPTQAR